jgi:hypothetical protein
MSALEAAWRQATGKPLPQAVRDWVTGHHDDPVRPAEGEWTHNLSVDWPMVSGAGTDVLRTADSRFLSD